MLFCIWIYHFKLLRRHNQQNEQHRILPINGQANSIGNFVNEMLYHLSIPCIQNDYTIQADILF